MKNTPDIDIVIVGNDHYNTLNVVRALGAESLKCGILIISDKAQCFVHKTRWMALGDVCSKEEVVSFLIEKFSIEGKQLPLIATDDTSSSIIDMHYEKLKDLFILPSCGEKQGALTSYMDKDVQLKLASTAGFNTPLSVALNLNEWPIQAIEEIKFPCIVKPEKSIHGSKQDFRICHNQEDLCDCLSELKKHIQHVLVQEFIPNDEVLAIGGVRGFNNDTYILGEINKYKKGSKPHNLGLACMGVLNPESAMLRECINLVEAIDYHGCFSIEVVRRRKGAFEDHPKNYFLEINLRTDGLYYYYTKAGINFPYIWYQCCKGKSVDLKPFKNPVYGINEFLYLREQPLKNMIKDFSKADVFSLFDWKDPIPFIYKILYNVKK